MSRGNIVIYSQLLFALYVRIYASSRPRARHNGESALSLALLTTASQARHAPRVALGRCKFPTSLRKVDSGARRESVRFNQFLKTDRNQNAFLSSYDDRSAEFEANRSKSAVLASAGDPFLCIESVETDAASRPKSGCNLLFRYSVARACGEPGNPTVRFQNPDRCRSV